MNVLPRHYCIGVTKMQKGRGGGGGGGIDPSYFSLQSSIRLPPSPHFTVLILTVCLFLARGGRI